MKKIHISRDGKARTCRAQTPESCTVVGPTGERSDHFENIEEAQAYSEKLMSEKLGGFKTIVKKYSQTDLNNIAKDSTDSAELEDAVKHGGKRVYANLSKNNHLTTAQIEEMIEKTDDRAVLANLRKLDSYPVEKLPLREFGRRSDARLNTYAVTNEADDEFAEKVLAYRREEVMAELLKNKNNKVSPEMATDLAISSFEDNINLIPFNPKVDVNKVLHQVSLQQLNNSAVKMTHPVMIDAVYKKMRSMNYSVENIARNENTPDSILQDMADNPEVVSDDQTSLYILNHHNSNENIVAALKKNSPIVQTKMKIDELTNEGKLKNIYSTEPTKLKTERAFKFDVNAMMENGLTKDDIDYIVRYRDNNWLFGATYNEDTGVYKGYIN